MDPSLWCFAVTYAIFLLNVRPSDAHNGCTPHEVFHKHAPNLSMAFIFGSPLHVKNRRASRHRPDSNTLLGTFVGFQGTAHIYQYIGDSGRVQYAHHAVVDELCVHRLPSDRSPAAKALLNHSAVDASVSTHTAALKTAISDLIPSCSPWLNHDMSVTEISDLLPDEAHGLLLHYHADLARCEIIGIEPTSAFGRRMTKGPIQILKGRVLLQINGNDIH